MFQAIVSHSWRAATKYPTLSLLVLFLGVAMVPAITSVLENLKTAIASPATAAAGLDPFGPPAGEVAALHAQYEAQRQQLALAQRQIAQLTQQLQQVQRFDRSRRDGEPEVDRVAATVLLAADAAALRRSIVIDRGSQHGLRPGDPVVHGRVLVGRLDAVGPFSSRVQLLTDPAFHGIKIMVLPPNADFATATDEALDGFARGLARGSGDKEMEVLLENIELDAEVHEGDLVFTSARSVTAPGGLIVGRIAAISRSQRAQFASVSVQPWADPSRLDQVQVIRWPRSLALDALLADG